MACGPACRCCGDLAALRAFTCHQFGGPTQALHRRSDSIHENVSKGWVSPGALQEKVRQVLFCFYFAQQLVDRKEACFQPWLAWLPPMTSGLPPFISSCSCIAGGYSCPPQCFTLWGLNSSTVADFRIQISLLVGKFLLLYFKWPFYFIYFLCFD